MRPWQYLTKSGYLCDVLRGKDDLSLAPARVGEAAGSSAIPQPAFTAAHECCGFRRFEEFQIHYYPLIDDSYWLFIGVFFPEDMTCRLLRWSLRTLGARAGAVYK